MLPHPTQGSNSTQSNKTAHKFKSLDWGFIIDYKYKSSIASPKMLVGSHWLKEALAYLDLFLLDVCLNFHWMGIYLAIVAIYVHNMPKLTKQRKHLDQML